MTVTLESLTEVIKDVHKEIEDDLCWMDIDRIFIAAGLPGPDRKVSNKAAMKKNCDRFIDHMCTDGKGEWPTYAELLEERDRLRTELGTYQGEGRDAWDEVAERDAKIKDLEEKIVKLEMDKENTMERIHRMKMDRMEE